MLSVLAGLLCGLLSGLGVGGGSLLLLYLTGISGLSPADARIVNLLCFLPTAAVSLLLHAKHDLVDRKTVLPAAVSGCLCGALVSYLGSGIDSRPLRFAFGLLLLAAGLLELKRAIHSKNKKAEC